jgi:hypothetical protein
VSQLTTGLSHEERNQQLPKKKRTRSPPTLAVQIDDYDKFVWGGEAIGQIISQPKHVVFYMARQGQIDVDYVGRRIRSTPRRLLKPARQAIAG